MHFFSRKNNIIYNFWSMLAFHIFEEAPTSWRQIPHFTKGEYCTRFTCFTHVEGNTPWFVARILQGTLSKEPHRQKDSTLIRCALALEGILHSFETYVAPSSMLQTLEHKRFCFDIDAMEWMIYPVLKEILRIFTLSLTVFYSTPLKDKLRKLWTLS